MLEDDPDKKSDQNAMYAWDLMERYMPEIVSRTKSDDRRFVHYRAKPKGLDQAVTAFIRQIRDGRESISTQRGNLSIFEPRIKDIERLKLQRGAPEELRI